MVELIKTVIINLARTAIWYAYEYEQFGELQWDRKCDLVVSVIYTVVIWILLLQARK